MQDNNIDGQSIIDGGIKENGLRNCGIYRFGERKQLMVQIKGLINHYRNIQKECRRGMNAMKDEMGMGLGLDLNVIDAQASKYRTRTSL